jgi:hypothetical protein
VSLTPSLCERCGAQFGCGAGTSACWCMDVAVVQSVRDDLAAAYERCLCKACLEAVAAGAPATLDR